MTIAFYSSSSSFVYVVSLNWWRDHLYIATPDNRILRIKIHGNGFKLISFVRLAAYILSIFVFHFLRFFLAYCNLPTAFYCSVCLAGNVLDTYMTSTAIFILCVHQYYFYCFFFTRDECVYDCLTRIFLFLFYFLLLCTFIFSLRFVFSMSICRCWFFFAESVPLVHKKYTKQQFS